MGDPDDEELQLAMELSKKTFEEDEERRQKLDATNLISFETPEALEHRRKVSEIQNMISQSEPYGWRQSLVPSKQQERQMYNPNFPPTPMLNNTPAPPLPPRLNRPPPLRAVTSTSMCSSASATPPSFPPHSATTVRPGPSLQTTPPRSSNPIAWRVQFSPSPAYRSMELFRNRESQSFEPSTSSDEPRNNELYIPYSMLKTPKKEPDGDLIDLAATNDCNVARATLDQIRREFDPLYDISPPMPHSLSSLERTKSLRTENTDTHITRPAAIKSVPVPPRRSESVDAVRHHKQEWLSIDSIKIVKNTPDVFKQISVLKQRWRHRSGDCSQNFSTATVDYMTTAAPSVKVVVEKDYTWPKTGESQMSMTCETATTTEMILTEVLARFLDESQLKQGVPVHEYGLKVYGLNEFLPENCQLGQNMYVGKCLLFGKDIKLEVGKKTVREQSSMDYMYNFADLQRNKTCVPSPSVLDLEDVENLLQHLNEEMRKFEEDALENNQLSVAATSNKVRQCVKMICKMLNGIEPVNLHHHLQRYLTAGEENKLKSARNDFIAAVHAFITAYCRSTMSAYSALPLKDTKKSTKRVIEVAEKMKIMVNSLHNIREEYLSTYQHFYVTVHAYYGTQELDGHAKVFPKDVQYDGFFPYCNMTIYAMFNTEVRHCPRETKLMFLLWGIRKEGVDPETGNGGPEHLAVASLPLFDHANIMRQGQFFVPMSALVGPVLQPWGGQPLICSQRDAVLIVTLPSYEYDVVFPTVVVEQQSGRLDIRSLSSNTQEYLMDLLDTTEPEKLSADDRETLWQRRHYLMLFPEALPLVLASVPSWGYGFLANVYSVLAAWAPLLPVQAIQLLLPQYPDRHVRAKAVEWIKKASSEFLFNCLPQLVEVMRFEIHEDSSLADLLLQLSYKDRRFAFEIYWQLQQRIDHCPNDFSACTASFVRRCQLLQQELLSRHESGQLCNDICLQHRLLNSLDDVQRELKNTDDGHKVSTLRSKLGILDSEMLQRNVRLPILPSFLSSGVDVSKCSIFNSNAKPLKIHFRGVKSSFSIIHKDGDDMRQDALVLQMVRLMNDIWLGEKLDLKMITFRCMPVGYHKGMAELVGDCSTLCEIQKAQGVSGVFKDDVLCKWLEKYNTTEYLYKVALDNFQRSCAGWCVATYILGIGDRHNDNILLTTMGHVFHIDFGKYMGDWQMAGGFKRDRVPFVFTKEMYIVINGGSAHSGESYQTFIDYCCRAFNYLRRKHAILTSLIKIMACSDIPGINIDSLQFMEKNLMLDLSDTDATTQFTQLITSSLNSAFTRLNFLVHTIAQLMSASGQAVGPTDNDHGLSFVPHRFTKDTDGKIRNVSVVGVEKHNMPQKVYLYKIEVNRENEAVRTTVYRSFAEFHELYMKLKYRFHEVPVLSRGSVVRSNVREVAMRRMTDVKVFLQDLFKRPPEISHCDLVYTFFHIILRDSTLENSIDDRPSMLSAGESQVLLKLQWVAPMQQLRIFVGHVKHLPKLSTGQPPDAYVKTYLRPNDALTGNSKQKTHVVRSSYNPTFNSELCYDLQHLSEIEAFFKAHLLDLSVWNSGGLKDNVKMYSLALPLQRIWLAESDRKGSRTLEGWFALSRVPGHSL